MTVSLQELKGVGPRKASLLETEAGIHSIEDLLYYAPRRYLDRSRFKKIRDAFAEEELTLRGIVKDIAVPRGRRPRLVVTIDDDSDILELVFFGAVRFLQKKFHPGMCLIVSGKISVYRSKQMVHPEFEECNSTSEESGRIFPLYSTTEALKDAHMDSRFLRRIIDEALTSYTSLLKDALPDAILQRHHLVPLHSALRWLHQPETMDQVEHARRRLAFDELLAMQYYTASLRKKMRSSFSKNRKPLERNAINRYTDALPFQLTSDQKNSLQEILSDLEKPWPMNRLLQGDVGSGKTVIALLAAIAASQRGEQTVLMAPTSLLAMQHFRTASDLLGDNMSITLLTGNMNQKERDSRRYDIETGQVTLVIGTHALFQEDIRFHNPGLIIIDEQHRFGVAQRAMLREKGNDSDLLVMSATPIPRSLALTLYGDLDISSIREKPAHRLPIQTLALPLSRIKGVYNSMEKYIEQGRQIYYVLPLVEESESLDLQSAEEVYQSFITGPFRHRRVALLHGRMKQDEKDGVMTAFSEGDFDILVSTSVIEVGIDVPNASVMILHHAERFGLSQLHQLRGRVGRGVHQSHCVLLHDESPGDTARKRIETMVNTSDGFEIAEADLHLRGAGEIIGQRQHGYGTELEFADFQADAEIVKAARDEAAAMVERNDTRIEEIRSLRSGSFFRYIS